MPPIFVHRRDSSLTWPANARLCVMRVGLPRHNRFDPMWQGFDASLLCLQPLTQTYGPHDSALDVLASMICFLGWILSYQLFF